MGANSWRRWAGLAMVGVVLVVAVMAQSIVGWYHQYRLNHGTVRFAIRVDEKVVGSGNSYATLINAAPGDTIEYVIIATNTGTGSARTVVFGGNLAPYLTYVCGSSRLVDSNTSSAGEALPSAKTGDCAGSAIVTGGQYVDNLYPGASENLYFQVQLGKCIPPGTHALQTVGTVRSGKGDQYYNVATANVDLPTSNAFGCGASST